MANHQYTIAGMRDIPSQRLTDHWRRWRQQISGSERASTGLQGGHTPGDGTARYQNVDTP